MSKLRIAIIGTGGISNSHVRAYKQMEDIEIVAGADIVPGKAREALDRWELPNAEAFEDTQAMLHKIKPDAVSVCTYNTAHAVCAIAAMRAGAHVLLEKPMTVTLEDAQELRRVEKETGKILTIGFQPRYDERMQKIKEVVQSGKLGQIYYVQTGGGRRRGIPGSTFIEERYAGVGALADIGCYSLDMVLNAMGPAYPHPLGYVLTEDFDVPHGMACAVFLPDLLRRSEAGLPERTARFYSLVGGKEAFHQALDLLVTADIRMTMGQVEDYARRWDPASDGAEPKDFARVAGGFTAADARDLFAELFVR